MAASGTYILRGFRLCNGRRVDAAAVLEVTPPASAVQRRLASVEAIAAELCTRRRLARVTATASVEQSGVFLVGAELAQSILSTFARKVDESPVVATQEQIKLRKC